MKILVDADTPLYRATGGVERVFTWDENLHTLVSDSKEARQLFVEDITKSQKAVERWLGSPCSVVLAFTDSQNWRKFVYPPYKSARISKRKPLAFSPTLMWLQKNYDCRIVPYLEADDVLGILSTSDADDCIIVSIDKDLKSVPGYLYNPDKGGNPRLVSKEEGDWFHVYQTLMGDTTDGYPGCPQVGPKTAQRALGKPGQLPLEELWRRTSGLYKRSSGPTDPHLQTGWGLESQAKVARILRKGEWNPEKKECTWTLPVV